MKSRRWQIVRIAFAVLKSKMRRRAFSQCGRRPNRRTAAYCQRGRGRFHADSHQLTLDLLKASEDIYGPNAPEKLLYSIFKKKTAALKAKAKGETVAERAKWLAHVRDAEGHMAEFLTNEKDGGPQILECHSPLLNVLEHYPIVGRLEQDMFEAVLGTRVRREVSRNSGLYECAFYFSA